jgi:hypothetical protein
MVSDHCRWTWYGAKLRDRRCSTNVCCARATYKLDFNLEAEQAVPNVFAGPKVMWNMMKFGKRFPGCGNVLVIKFLPRDLRERKVSWWAS